MRIKQLELVGFKSFPQRTVLDFPRGVTGVVGPNGCGKSNIVDAIRWVLGEQSAKHLRGDVMEAVIFNGNEKHSPLGMAEVSLTFDNDGSAWQPLDADLDVSAVPSQFREATEISITRRYFRSGESEYYINRTPCRLKDITELFLGTGIGSKAYAIIEQGKVEQLINAKPEERRLFIEEAAGTTLYRNRKLAAERKMERARENLARVNDILREIDRQVGYLQRQAKKAEEFKRLQVDVRDLDLKLSGAHWTKLQGQLREIESTWETLCADEDQARQALGACEASQRDASEQVAGAEKQLGELREVLSVLEADRQQLRERVLRLEQECSERERRHTRLLADAAAAGQSSERLAVDQAGAEQARDQWAQQLQEDEAELGRREQGLADARSAATADQVALEQAKAALIGHVTREVETRNLVSSLERRRDDAARQLSRLRMEDEQLTARLQTTQSQLEARRADAAQLRADLAQAAGEKETRAERMRSLAEARRRWQREVSELEALIVQTRSRLESLEQIQNNYEGFDRGVRAIMREEHHADGVMGVVADVIDIPQNYERAVAAVLGDRLQYMIVGGAEAGADAVNMLRRDAGGRASFIPLQPRLEHQKMLDAASLNGTSKRLLDMVRFDSQYRGVAESLLGEVVLVPDLQQAVDIYKRNGIHVTLVTPEGDVIDSSGVITGGSDRPIEEDFLARRREIESLRLTLAEALERIAVMREELEQVSSQIAESEDAVRSLGENVHELTVKIVSAEKDIERLEHEVPQCNSRLDVVRYEIDALTQDDRAMAEELELGRSRFEELAVERQLLEETATTKRQQSASATQTIDALSSEVTGVKVRVAEKRQRQVAATATAESLARQRAELATRVAALAAEAEATEQERIELVQSLDSTRQVVAEREQRRDVMLVDVEAAESEVRRQQTTHRECEEQVRQTYGILDELRGRKAQVEVSRSEIRLRTEHLTQTIHEKYEADLGVYAVEAADLEVAEGDPDRLENLRQRLARIGDVNMAAIEELRELEERGGFLRTQKNDLEQSLGDLERTIQKLNRVSRSRFAETFARANETFQKVFPRLFRGGEAKLVLTDENNLLETGVEIVVRPPGKRLDSMALLSGGEKALVAVSLIFSLFLINPTPFCILDEVDAPLDDANIGRFGQMIREMSDRLQFLIITHNKRTMETADALYGVTMQEPGVSKVISVHLNS